MKSKKKPKSNVISTGKLGGAGEDPAISAKIGGIGNRTGAKSELKPGVKKG